MEFSLVIIIIIIIIIPLCSPYNYCLRAGRPVFHSQHDHSMQAGSGAQLEFDAVGLSGRGVKPTARINLVPMSRKMEAYLYSPFVVM
jgi:hypothetical protein